jgi:type IV secretory pathway VirB6-like protein
MRYQHPTLRVLCLWVMTLLCIAGIPQFAHATNDDCPQIEATDDGESYDSSVYSYGEWKWAQNCNGNEREAPPFYDGPYDGGHYNDPSDPDWESAGAANQNWERAPIRIISSSCQALTDYLNAIKAGTVATDPALNASWGVDTGCLWNDITITVGSDQAWYEGEIGADGNPAVSCSDSGNASWWSLRCTAARSNETYELGASDTAYHWGSAAKLVAEREGDKLCVYAYGVGFLEYFVDCVPLPDPPPSETPDKACWVADQCWGEQSEVDVQIQYTDAEGASQTYGRWEWPLTSIAAECVTKTIGQIFEGNPCADSGVGLFESVRNNFRRAVMLAMTLYVMLLGVRAAFGQIESHQEVVQSFIKILVVMYFAVSDGWTVYYPYLIGGIAELATYVANTAGVDANGDAVGSYCVYPASFYPAESVALSLWDTLDCKMFYYLGMSPETPFPMTLLIAIAGIWSGNILFSAILILFAIIFILTVIQAVQIYLVSVVVVSIMVYVSPLFIPMVLFQQTKQFFNNWLDELVGYSLYPMVMFAFLALMTGVFDQIYWGPDALDNMTWDGNDAIVDMATGCSDDNKSIGCYIKLAMDHVDNYAVPVLGFVVPTADSDAPLPYEYLPGVLKAVLFGVLFFFFMGSLPSLVQAITGTLRSGAEIMPGNSSVGDAAKKAKAGIKGKKAERAKNKSGDNKESQKADETATAQADETFDE